MRPPWPQQEKVSWQTPSIREALEMGISRLKARGIASAAADCSLLLAKAMGWDRYRVLAEPRCSVAPAAMELYRGFIARREQFEPVQYILGEQEFMGLSFQVSPAVLIPRPETETLVEGVIEFLSRCEEAQPLVAEPCTGSGCIAVSLAKFLPSCQVVASDVSQEALEVAKRNAQRHAVLDRVELLWGDMLEPIVQRGLQRQVVVVVCNPPYVPEPHLSQLPEEVRLYEPELALNGGPDGLRYYRTLASQAPQLLRPGGMLAVEVDSEKARDVVDILGAAGCFSRIEVRKDLAGLDRVVLARTSRRKRRRREEPGPCPWQPGNS
ncbi:MAG: peptide chain release factor N(5)-glutamine methyltransferase [Bacillota bacterium]